MKSCLTTREVVLTVYKQHLLTRTAKRDNKHNDIIKRVLQTGNNIWGFFFLSPYYRGTAVAQ